MALKFKFKIFVFYWIACEDIFMKIFFFLQLDLKLKSEQAGKNIFFLTMILVSCHLCRILPLSDVDRHTSTHPFGICFYLCYYHHLTLALQICNQEPLLNFNPHAKDNFNSPARFMIISIMSCMISRRGLQVARQARVR
jgi:hypothetical protein